MDVRVVEGIFVQGSHISVDGVDVGFHLKPYQNAQVEVHLHHFPHAVHGVCLWHGHCPYGHQDNPSWLHHQRLEGLLSYTEGQWCVGGIPLRLDLMPGHYGRLIIHSNAGGIQLQNPVSDLNSLLSEVDDLMTLLQGLKKAVSDV